MKPKLALVEDNPDNRLLVWAILEDEYEISEYESGRDAVEGSDVALAEDRGGDAGQLDSQRRERSCGRASLLAHLPEDRSTRYGLPCRRQSHS